MASKPSLRTNLKQKANMKGQRILNEQHIYNKELVTFKVCIPFTKIQKDMNKIFFNYAKYNIVGKCHKEGYISPSFIKVMKYTSGNMQASNVYFDVVYEFDVFYPCEDMEIDCYVQSFTKIGIKAIVNKNEKLNPCVIFASQAHNEELFMNEGVENDEGEMNSDTMKEGDKIKIKVLGSRFEINDPYISLLGKIIKK